MLFQMVCDTQKAAGVRVEPVCRRDTPPSQVRDMPRARVQGVECPQERSLPALLTQPAGAKPNGCPHSRSESIALRSSAASIRPSLWLWDWNTNTPSH